MIKFERKVARLHERIRRHTGGGASGFLFAHDKFFQLTPPWFLPDKREHLLGSAFLFCLFYFWTDLPLGLCALSAFICGLLWEIKDGIWNDGFSWKDLIADCIGIGVMWRMAV